MSKARYYASYETRRTLDLLKSGAGMTRAGVAKPTED